MLDDSVEKSRMIADLVQMDALVQSVLTHLRDGQSDEVSTVLDLRSLLQTIADGYADLCQARRASGRPTSCGPRPGART